MKNSSLPSITFLFFLRRLALIVLNSHELFQSSPYTASSRGYNPLLCLFIRRKNQKPKTLLLSIFLLLTFNLSTAFALPLQDPIPGTYQCFSSQENAFAEEVEDIGATLEFVDASTYRFTTTSASEEGTVKSYDFESGDEAFDAVWQSGSVLELQPSSGSAPYAGMFLLDNLGASYIIVQNNNGLYIRCQSEGADIAATFGFGDTTNAETEGETPTLEPTVSSQQLTPLQAVKSGVYTCSYTFDYLDESDDEPDVSSVFIFDDGSTLTIDMGEFYSYSDGTSQFIGNKDVFVSQYAKGKYSFDAANSKMSFQGGSLGGLTMAYGTNAEGEASLSYISQDDTWTTEHSCSFMQDLPSDSGLGFSESTPQVDLNNITVATSKYDPSINPNDEPIVDTYYCYPDFGFLEIGEGLPRYVREHKLEILPNKQYSFDGEQGTFATKVDDYLLQWQSGPLNPTSNVIKSEDDVLIPHTSGLAFDTWGSEISGVEIPQDDSPVQVDCFQQGAREQKALLDFALNQPTQASYTCLPSGDNPQSVSLELLPDNLYTFNGQQGSYQTQADEYNGDIIWESGPLAGSDTRYNADDETGSREITFSTTETYGAILPTGSSTEQTMFCQAVVKANLIPKYAASTIAPPPAGTGGLEGFYAHAEYDQGDLINGQPPVTTWTYYHFLPNGYVYEDGYSTGDDCTKSYPNGQPVCKGYSYSNNKITFTDGTAIGVTQADGGDILLDGVLYENKTLSGPQTLDGAYEYVLAIAAPAYMNLAGMGTNSVTTQSYTFSPDSTYSYSYDSWSQTSAPAFDGSPMGTIGALSSSGSTDGDSGTYTIDGNVITFKSDQGFTTQCGFFFPFKGDTTKVNICGVDYDPPSPQ